MKRPRSSRCPLFLPCEITRSAARVRTPINHEKINGSPSMLRVTFDPASTMNDEMIWLTSKPQSFERFMLLVGQFFIEPPAQLDRQCSERRKELLLQLRHNEDAVLRPDFR